MSPEQLFQSWQRANHLGAIVGECNAMVIDKNQFIKFIKVQSPPPNMLQIAFVPPEIIRFNDNPAAPSAKGPTIHKLEVKLIHKNYEGWAVYG